MTQEGGFDNTHNVDQEMALLDDSLSQLRGFEYDTTHPRSGEADTGRTFLQTYLQPHRERFATLEVIPTIHGPILYGDPHANLPVDSDLALVGEAMTTEGFAYMQDEIEEPLRSGPTPWPTGPEHVNVTFATIYDALQGSRSRHQDPRLGNEALFTVLHILSGRAIFSEDESKLSLIQERMREALKTNAHLRTGATSKIQEALSIRKLRRGINP